MMALTTLQNPVKARLEAINTDLKDVNKAQKAFGKALDKVSIPARHHRPRSHNELTLPAGPPAP